MTGSLSLFSILIIGVKDKDIGIPSLDETFSFNGNTSVAQEI